MNSVVSVSVLLPGLGSVVGEATVAVFRMVPVALASRSTPICTVACAPAASGPSRLQTTVVVPVQAQVPSTEVTVPLKVNPAGSGSVMVTVAAASDGP